MEKILIIDDDPSILHLLEQVLSLEGYQVLKTENAEKAHSILKTHQVDVVITDVSMPGKSGIQLLKELNQSDPELPVIIMTGVGTMQTAIEASRFDAYEYVTKPFDTEEIISLLKRLSERLLTRKRVSNFEAKPAGDNLFGEIVGKSPAIQRVFKQIGKVLKTPVSTPVLLLGESGTGKGLAASVIHHSGDDHNEQFLRISCAATQESLLDGEMFGYSEDSSSEADEEKVGYLELAGSGTVFIDEIDEMPLQIQNKFLRVLEERVFYRIGSSNEVGLHARVIAATNRDLTEEIRKNRFRNDLYYRLNDQIIILPPLRKRKEDIPLLAVTFLNEASRKVGKSVNKISSMFMEQLISYDYPGNVRELKNVISHSVLMARSNVLLPEDLSEYSTQVVIEHEDTGIGQKGLMDGSQERKLSAILFTDIIRFSQMMGEDEGRALSLLEEHDRLVEEMVWKHKGVILKHIGDSVMASFASAVHAVSCAVKIQTALARRNMFMPDSEQILIRIGIHIGDVVIKGYDIIGDGVNIAARIEPLCDPGGICISQDVLNQVRNQLDIKTESLGPRELKNIQSPVHIYKVLVNLLTSAKSVKAND